MTKRFYVLAVGGQDATGKSVVGRFINTMPVLASRHNAQGQLNSGESNAFSFLANVEFDTDNEKVLTKAAELLGIVKFEQNMELSKAQFLKFIGISADGTSTTTKKSKIEVLKEYMARIKGQPDANNPGKFIAPINEEYKAIVADFNTEFGTSHSSESKEKAAFMSAVYEEITDEQQKTITAKAVVNDSPAEKFKATLIKIENTVELAIIAITIKNTDILSQFQDKIYQNSVWTTIFRISLQNEIDELPNFQPKLVEMPMSHNGNPIKTGAWRTLLAMYSSWK